MIWPFSIFDSRVPALRELPWKIFTAAAFGALTGPQFALAFATLSGHLVDLTSVAHPWEVVGVSCAVGAIFAVSFYTICGLPAMWITPLLTPYSRWKRTSIRGTVAMTGAALAYSMAVVIAGWLTPVRFAQGRLSVGMVAIEALIALVISLVITVMKEKEVQTRRAAETAALAQATALQAQIHPHFFFNTLNTVSALIPIDGRAAQDTIGRLADMFRYTMGCSSGGSVTLDDELQFIRNYLAIESARFGDRVQFHIEDANGAGSVRLPGLTLQPLVENGIKYGLAERVDGGELNIRICHDAASCTVTVRNQFDASCGVPDLSPSAVFRSGHALANIRERLRLAFGNRASIQVKREGDWIASTLVVPMGEKR